MLPQTVIVYPKIVGIVGLGIKMYRETNIFPIFVRQPLEYLTKKENKLDYIITIDLKDPRWIDKNEKNTRREHF